MSGKNSTEYRKLVAVTAKLTNLLAVDDNVVTLSQELKTAGLINVANSRNTANVHVSADVRAANLVDMVTTKVELNSKYYAAFVDILKKDTVTYEQILQDLGELSQATPREVNPQQNGSEQEAPPQQHIHNKRPSESPNSKGSSQASRAIAADFSEVFSKSMNRDQLREWLLHKLGKDHEENIDKLYEQRVGGKTFLRLTDAILKTNFDIKDFGSRQEILDLVEELKECEQQPGQGHEVQHHSTSQAHRDEKRNALIGVHRRADDRFPTNPSKTDLEFLNEKYREKFGGPPQKKKNVVADFDEPESGPPHKKKAVPVFDDEEAKKPDTSQPKFEDVDGPAAKQKPTDDRYWCNVIKRPCKQPDAPGGAGASGVAVIEALWRKEVVGVKFNLEEKNLQLLSKWKLENGNKMTTATIISWANTWNTRCCSSKVPRFVDVDEHPDLVLNHDIKVDFNENGDNRSLIGTEAMHYRIDPDGKFTMHLSLEYATTDSLKKHYIIHEFGHALGLGHEHQRAKFWRIVYPFVYTELMKHDPTIGGVQKFDTDWTWILESYYTSDLGANSVEYDPDSIMHYWFDVKWLNMKPAGEKYKDYSDVSNVEMDKEDLQRSGAYEVLKGLHNRGIYLPPAPSRKDIAFLKKCYETRK